MHNGERLRVVSHDPAEEAGKGEAEGVEGAVDAGHGTDVEGGDVVVLGATIGDEAIVSSVPAAAQRGVTREATS